jgi:8-oxo-dGTP diphosphatase
MTACLFRSKFSLLELQMLYEGILGVSLDKPNFRRKMQKMNLLISCDEKQLGVAHRAAALYRFDKERYFELKQQGFVFEV